jgi:hypothetical protein
LGSAIGFKNDAAKVAGIVGDVTVRSSAMAVDVRAVIKVGEHGFSPYQ